MADEPVTETPIEEWQRNTRGREYAVIRGPGGGTVFRKGNESVSDARARRAAETEAKRAQQRAAGEEPRKPGRPKGKGRKPDPKPGPASAPSGGKSKPSREQLAAGAELPLQILAAFVGRAMLECDFCAARMAQNAGGAAKDLAASSNPYVIQLLTWWHGIISSAAGLDGFAAYLGPPIVHHVLPGPAAAFISPVMGIPPRQPKPRHSHTSPAGERTAPAPPPGPESTQDRAGPPAGGDTTIPVPPSSNGLAPESEREALMRERIELEARIRNMSAQPNVPPYSAREQPPGPQAPPVDPQAAAGSPLPPDYDAGISPE